MRRLTARCFAAGLLGLAGAFGPGEARATEAAAVIFMYHRFGEGESASASVRLDQLDEHIAELKGGRYAVRPLVEVVEQLRAGRALPDRTVGLSVDDAHISFYRDAWPRLKKAGLPVTLFFATEGVDAGAPGSMSWNQIRELMRDGLAIGGPTVSHPRLPALSMVEVAQELERARARVQAELGVTPTLFAYPYGEYSLAIRNLVGELGYAGAFGQHSGVAHGRADMLALPRFALSEAYAGIDRFRLAANALPLPVTELLPRDPVLRQNPPAFGFTVAESLGDLQQLACFASGQGRVRVERLGSRIEVRLGEPFPPGRSRINCTMPAAEGRWRWLGVQFYVPG